MTEYCKNDHEGTSKKKKRSRLNSTQKSKDTVSYSLYEENFAESYVRKLSQRLDENSFHEMLSILEEFDNEDRDIKALFDKTEIILKNQEDLRREFLGFLEPSQAHECGKLMLFYEMYNMKQFICNLMIQFKRQPHLLNKILEKLSSLAERDNVRQSMVDESIIPFLQKNSCLLQQFLQLLPEGKIPDWCFSYDDSWEDFSIDCEMTEEETFDIPSHLNESSTRDSKNCIYRCEQNKFTCPICNVKFINGRMYVVDGKILRPAQLIFDSPEQADHVRRLSEKRDYFAPMLSKPRNSRKVDANTKDASDDRLASFILGTESEEELGDNELHRRKRKKGMAQRLKIRFDADKKGTNNLSDSQIDDTAPSNDEISCDEVSKEDNDYTSCEDVPTKCSKPESNVISSGLVHCATIKETVKLGDMELNFSRSSLPWSMRTHSEKANE